MMPFSTGSHPSATNREKSSAGWSPPAALATCSRENLSPTNGMTLFMCANARSTSPDEPAIAPSSAKSGAISKDTGSAMRG
eukprot:9501003-Pyramimonas_sp.AAC.1